MSAILSSKSPQHLSHSLITENNLALQYYSPPIYALADGVEYLCFGLAIAALLMLLLGLIGGKLTVLEHLAVLQLTYLCVITVQDASPTFAGLRSLRLSAGSIPTSDYNYSSSLDRQLKGASFSSILFSVYNIGLITIILPMCIAIVLKLASVSCFKDNEALMAVSSSILGQTTFYAIIFSVYAILSQLLFQLNLISAGITSAFNGFGFSILLLVLTFIYCYCLNKYPK
jgi:hypothetical protein